MSACSSEPMFWISYGNTFIYTFFGTAMSLRHHDPRRLCAVAAALVGAGSGTCFIAFTMWFNAGHDPVLPEHARPRPSGSLFRHYHRLCLQRLQHHPAAQLLRERCRTPSRRRRKMDGANELQISGRCSSRCPSRPSSPSLCSASWRAGTAISGQWCCCVAEEKIPLQVYLSADIVDLTANDEFASSC